MLCRCTGWVPPGRACHHSLRDHPTRQPVRTYTELRDRSAQCSGLNVLAPSQERGGTPGRARRRAAYVWCGDRRCARSWSSRPDRPRQKRSTVRSSDEAVVSGPRVCAGPVLRGDRRFIAAQAAPMISSARARDAVGQPASWRTDQVSEADRRIADRGGPRSSSRGEPIGDVCELLTHLVQFLVGRRLGRFGCRFFVR